MSKRPLLKMCVLVLSALMLFAPFASAQQPEWMMKIPKYQRLTAGNSHFSVDTTRNAILYDGGAYDTYVTYDQGKTWETIFDMKMFFIDGAAGWRIDASGNWYYVGVVYADPIIHLVTEDAGKTIRYLVVDTNDVPYSRQKEPEMVLVQPNAVYLDYAGVGSDPKKQGLYVTCDAGRTWKLLQRADGIWSAPIIPTVVSANSVALGLGNRTFAEYNLCTSTWDSTDIVDQGSYQRLNDGTLLLFNVRLSDVPMFVRKRGVPTVDTISMYTDPENGVQRKFIPRVTTRLNDTMSLILAKNGVIATYSVNAGLKFIDIPPLRNPYQQVVDVGTFGDRVLLRTVVPTTSPDSIVRWTMLDVKTGAHTTRVQPGGVFVSRSLFYWAPPLLQNQRIVPFSDSSWLFSPEPGELFRTTNAGGTWTMVDNIDRDERWGLNFIAAKRLYPRGDGTMAVLTEHNRLMLFDSGSTGWYAAHLGPFAHTTKGTGAFAFSHNSTAYTEDFNGRFRSRYGPSTVFFQQPTTLWMSGDIVTSWTEHGHFIDTVLPRKARVVKRVSPNLVVAAMDSVWFTFNEGKDWIEVSQKMPFAIHGADTARAAIGDIIEAKNGELIAGLRGTRLHDTTGVVIDSIPGGIIRSDDKGATWTPGSIGIPQNLYVCSLLKLPTGTILALAAEVRVDPTIVDDLRIRRMKLSDCGRPQHKLDQVYIYRSVDHGHSWTKVHIFPSREYLPLVDPRLTLMPDGRVMAIHPDAGIAISPNDGVWFSVGDPLYIGNPVVNDVVFTDDGWAHFATDSGYLRLRIDNILNVHAESSVSGSLTAYVNALRMLRIADPTMVPTSIRLISLDGRVVRQAFDVAGVSELDVSALATGTYVVVASTVNDVRTALVQLYR